MLSPTRNQRLQFKPIKFDPSKSPRDSQLQHRSEARLFFGCQNNQFWQWASNNCAPATFMTVTEAVSVRVGQRIERIGRKWDLTLNGIFTVLFFCGRI
jgi:hypothetical protein